jgi:hypothetical protein
VGQELARGSGSSEAGGGVVQRRVGGQVRELGRFAVGFAVAQAARPRVREPKPEGTEAWRPTPPSRRRAPLRPPELLLLLLLAPVLGKPPGPPLELPANPTPSPPGPLLRAFWGLAASGWPVLGSRNGDAKFTLVVRRRRTHSSSWSLVSCSAMSASSKGSRSIYKRP